VLAVAVIASLALCGVYVAAGGGTYKPAKVADPCKQREWRSPEGIEAFLDQIALSAADGAACELGVTREEFVLAMSSDAGRSKFVKEHKLTEDQVDDAVRAGMRRAADDAREAGAIGGLENFVLQQLIDEAPIDFILDRIGRP
jgi:hypothetical protein